MSKRVFQHPPETTGGRKYWRSLGQLADTPEFRGWLEREFPQGASEINGSEVSRRSFLQFMGASAALAGLSLTGCVVLKSTWCRSPAARSGRSRVRRCFSRLPCRRGVVIRRWSLRPMTGVRRRSKAIRCTLLARARPGFTSRLQFSTCMIRIASGHLLTRVRPNRLRILKRRLMN
jgi:MoCo/4Fe-4S cofactor protein with predicted Tat translocation signal